MKKNIYICIHIQKWVLPRWLSGKESAYNSGATEDMSSISGSGRSPGEGNSNPLQYSCLENPLDGGAWLATVHEVAKSRTWLSDFTFYFLYIYDIPFSVNDFLLLLMVFGIDTIYDFSLLECVKTCFLVYLREWSTRTSENNV